MEMKFSFIIRQAMQVASAVAEEEIVGAWRPVLLSVSKPEEKNDIAFRYEGGLVVRVFLQNMQELIEPWRRDSRQEDWAVWQVALRRPVGDGKKAEEVWDAARLSELKARRSWWHPRVVTREEIEEQKKLLKYC